MQMPLPRTRSKQKSLFFRCRPWLVVGAEDAHLARTEPDRLANLQLQGFVALAREFDFDDLGVVLQLDAHHRANRMHVGHRRRHAVFQHHVGQINVVRTNEGGGLFRIFRPRQVRVFGADNQPKAAPEKQAFLF